MQTPHRWFGAGHSIAADSAKAGAEAAASAVGGRTPAVVFVFASHQHDLPALLMAVRDEAGPNALVVGASTLGELAYDGASAGGVSVAALGGEGFTVRAKVAHIGDAGHRRAGAEAAEAMAGVTSPHSVLILLADGLSGDPHEVVRGAYSVLGAVVPLVGGFAGGGSDKSRTFQFIGDTVYTDAVVGVALGSDAPIGIGVAHGWHRVEPPMIITSSRGGRIFELDDEPALDVLLRRNDLAGQRAADLFHGVDALQALGLSRRNGEDIRVIHDGDDVDRSILGMSDVPQGALCWLMEADHDALIRGATDSCREALDGLGGKVPLGVLAFDCGARRGRLGPDGMQEEMAAMRSALGSTPYAGFYTAGEIARVRGALGTHHLTLVTLALA
ncbi:FIST N-terminal domain-containing protein [Actinoplanes sp. NPDC051470]|uniref:FIST signal transduction protein n=1 Tax=Actinoplanes sp. NPDC051470 TaxID=3157224 RepID=UPI00342C7E87